MTGVTLACITMSGNEYVLYERNGTHVFPSGQLNDGEHPADAARRIVKEWTGTEIPKLEVVDFMPEKGDLLIVFRAILVSDPKPDGAKRFKRMELPASTGQLKGPWVEEALKTSLAYKLTRG